MKLQNPRGMRDLNPEESIFRNQIIGIIKETFESYGFSPLETPLIERFDVLSAKYAGGDEILKETFKLKDQGKRELGLRYDLTVPMCRFVGMNPNVKLPFKRYQIGEVFRDGPVEKARYRQFTQCDVDAVGISSMAADAEIIMLASRAFKKLGFEPIIRINNRKLLNDLLENAGVNKEKLETVILSIDKLEKFGLETVKKELKEKKTDSKTISSIAKITGIKGSNNEKISNIKKIVKNSKGLNEIEELFSLLKILN